MPPANTTPQPGELLASICRIANRHGADEDHVIAGGGNASCKDDRTLWIKGSGTELATITADGFVALDRGALQRALESDFGEEPNRREALYKDALMAARRQPERNQRPSVETLMHHIVPGRYVLHTHCNPVNMLTCCQEGRRLVRDLFGDRVLWIPYVDPGYVLSRQIGRLLKGHWFPAGEPPILMMEGHGLVVAGDDPDSIDRTLERLLGKIAGLLRTRPAAPERPLANPDPARVELVRRLLAEALAEDGKAPATDWCNDDPVATFLARPDAEKLALSGPLTPDQIVYCKSFPLWLDAADDDNEPALAAKIRDGAAAFRRDYGHAPKVILAPRIGLLSAAPDARAAWIVQRVYRDAIKIKLGADRLGGIRFMSARDRSFIDNWEVEQFRRQVAAQR